MWSASITGLNTISPCETRCGVDVTDGGNAASCLTDKRTRRVILVQTITFPVVSIASFSRHFETFVFCCRELQNNSRSLDRTKNELPKTWDKLFAERIMSKVTKRGVRELPVGYCVETESNSNSQPTSFKGFSGKVEAEIRAQTANNISPETSLCLESSIESVDETESSGLRFHSARKRRRRSSSSEESCEPKSRSVSPEISYGGMPVIYKLKEKEGGFLIVKVAMNAKREKRQPQRCTEQDISHLLDSDDEDPPIFDPVIKVSGQVDTPLRNGKKAADTPKTPRGSKKNLAAANNEKNSPSGTPSRSKTLQNEVSLKLKLRRSTEQSNYKIAVDHDEDKTRRTSRRSNIGTPKKCGLGDCDEDHSMHTRTRRSPQKTPKRSNVLKETAATTPSPRRTRRNSKTVDGDGLEMKSLHNKENESEADNNMEEDPDTIVARGRITRSKSRSMTPQKEIKALKDTAKGTPRKAAKRSQPATPRQGYLETSHIIEVLHSDDESVESRPRARRKEEPETPHRTRKAGVAPSTPSSSRPRRNSKTVHYNLDYVQMELLSDGETEDADEVIETRGRSTRRPATTPQTAATPQKQRKVLEEASTPKRTPRRTAAQTADELATPKRTPRRTAAQTADELATPKRTPRKSVLQRFEEASTPKRTPRKPATIPEDEEPTTPSTKRRNAKVSTPSVKHGNLTPSMTRRTAHVGRPKTVLEEARAQLHVSTVPKSLPCRDKEFNNVFRFLKGKLEDQSSGCIYISGVPGTGKTATVTEVIRALKRCVANGDLDDFDFIEINGMKLSEPRQAYVQILKQITGETPTWEQAYGILDKLFTKSKTKRPMTLLLVDELDLLCNKRQDVVYNLLDWPAKQNAHLVVITIANTMDLPERILISRVTSRLGLTRLTFQPYTFSELQEIVTARLKDSDAFRSEAIQLAARKVAAVSGDARRALDICRRATEITELKGEKTVTMQHVNETLQEMIASPKIMAIKMCSEMEIYFLRAVDAEVTRTGVEEVVFQDIYRQLTTICSFEGVKTPNVTQAIGICSRLTSYRLLLCEQTRNDAERRVILNVSSDDIHFAVQTIDVS